MLPILLENLEFVFSVIAVLATVEQANIPVICNDMIIKFHRILVTAKERRSKKTDRNYIVMDLGT